MTEDRAACRRRAMDLLARREHSRLELERKLSARGFERDLVGEVLEELANENLQSDERFAESFVAARYGRGQGPFRIRQELEQRGIGRPDSWLSDERFDWSALACEVRCRRFGGATPGDLKEKARQTRFLEYRGFSHQQIRRALESEGE